MPAPKKAPAYEVKKRDMDRALKRIQKFSGEPFRRQARVWVETGIDLKLKNQLKNAAPKDSGLLARKVRRKSMRRPAGHFFNVGIKSRAPHAGLVSKGHSYGGVTVKGDPYVQNVINAHESKIFDWVGDKMRDHASDKRAF